MLLNHHEDLKQAIPLALIGAAFLALLWLALAGSRPAVWGLRAVMSLFVLAGLLGVALHFQSTLEFQREIDPSLRGFDLAMRPLEEPVVTAELYVFTRKGRTLPPGAERFLAFLRRHLARCMPREVVRG